MPWAQWLVNNTMWQWWLNYYIWNMFHHNSKGMGLIELFETYFIYIFIYTNLSKWSWLTPREIIYRNPQENTFIKPVITNECICTKSAPECLLIFKSEISRVLVSLLIISFDSQYSSIPVNILATEWTVLIFIQRSYGFTSENEVVFLYKRHKIGGSVIWSLCVKLLYGMTCLYSSNKYLHLENTHLKIFTI